MSSILEEVRDLQRQAQLDRKRGDALRKARRETDACSAFEAGVSKLERCLLILDGAHGQELPDLAADRAETLGSLAGLLRRLGKNEAALAGYTAGAAVEHDFKLTSTYNRVNEIKYSLLTGHATLSSLQPRIRALAEVLYEALMNPNTQQLSDSAWAWADLGDCRALLGELTEASRAYATFISKADIKSPETTLDVLQNIADELIKNQDPDSGRVSHALTTLQSQIRTVAAAGLR